MTKIPSRVEIDAMVRKTEAAVKALPDGDKLSLYGAFTMSSIMLTLIKTLAAVPPGVQPENTLKATVVVLRAIADHLEESIGDGNETSVIH